MPAFVTRLAALVLLGLAGPSEVPARLPATGEVVAEGLDVFDEPDETSFTTMRLKTGDKVTVRDADRFGWLTIDPPPGSFCWVEQDAIGEVVGGTKSEIIAPEADARSGHPSARLPGAPCMRLRQGTMIRLVDRPPLKVGQGREARTWLAIEPPQGEVRHVRASGVKILGEPVTNPEGKVPPQETQAAFFDSGDLAGLPPEIATEVRQIEATHRSILREPVEQWRLDLVQKRYQDLLKRVTDTNAGNVIRGRLALVASHQEVADAARTIQTILDRSRRRDRDLAMFQRRLAEADRPQSRPFDAEGLIQPSSRKVDGQKVLALIGPEGKTLAYLDVPPGLDAQPLISRHVGVRGAVHFNETLRARLISVRDLEPLDAPR